MHSRFSLKAGSERLAGCFIAAVMAVGWSTQEALRAEDDVDAGLRRALSLHASFDGGAAADFARGDRVLYHAPAHDRREAPEPGLPPTGEVVLAETAGRAGRALHFLKTKAPVVLFKAEKNFPSPKPDWSATLSCWLSVDPSADLAPGFCDPVQVTSKKWDDAAIFLEFEKRAEGIPFRLGVYADTAVWNPQGRKWEDIPAAEKPLVTVADPPFGKDRWTHVVVVVEHFNTGRRDGSARLYLNGREAGRIGPRQQTFTWDMDRAAILLGIGYAGFMDDLAVFDRALGEAEISRLHALGTGLPVLHPKP